MPRLGSMGTKLYHKPSSTYVEIPDCKSYPSFMGAPEQVETTCISDTQKTYAPGQSDPGEMAFVFAYSGMGAGTNWATLYALQTAGTAADWQVVFPDDSGFRWNAKIALSMNEVGDGNSPLEFTVTMFPTGAITPVADTEA